jgi:hypothetical protein
MEDGMVSGSVVVGRQKLYPFLIGSPPTPINTMPNVIMLFEELMKGMSYKKRLLSPAIFVSLYSHNKPSNDGESEKE